LIGFAETLTSTSQQLGFSASFKGDLEALLAAVVESFYLNYGRKVRSQMAIIPIMLSIYMLTAIIVGTIGAVAIGRLPIIPEQVGIILPLLGLGILPTATAHTLYFSSLSNLKSFETATMALLEPIGATLLGIMLFHEIPAYPFVFGAALIMLGILFIVKEKV
jgi:drug/metabolite transporter (DMT)-like permease